MLIFDRRIGVPVQDADLRVPEVDVRLTILRRFRLLTLNLGQSLLFLISHAGVLICGFASNQECASDDQRNELKLFHI